LFYGNPGQRRSDFPLRYPALDFQGLDIDHAIASITQFHMDMGWGMVVPVHQYPKGKTAKAGQRS